MQNINLEKLKIKIEFSDVFENRYSVRTAARLLNAFVLLIEGVYLQDIDTNAGNNRLSELFPSPHYENLLNELEKAGAKISENSYQNGLGEDNVSWLYRAILISEPNSSDAQIQEIKRGSLEYWFDHVFGGSKARSLIAGIDAQLKQNSSGSTSDQQKTIISNLVRNRKNNIAIAIIVEACAEIQNILKTLGTTGIKIIT